MLDHRIELRGLVHHVVEHHGDLARDSPARTVVLLHGYLDHARVFDKLAAELPDLHLLAIDLRGHGDTGWVGAGGYYHFYDYVADVHALIHRLAKPPVAIVGHSMGGGVARMLAAAFPSLVTHLCLIEGLGTPAVPFDDAPSRVRAFVEDLGRLAARAPRRFATIEEAAARVRQHNPRISESDALHFARHGTRPLPEGGFTWKFDPLHQTRAPWAFHEELQLPFLRAITAKTLVIEGADGYLLADEVRARRVAALRPIGELRIPGAGHHVFLDAPAAVAAALRDLLAR
jgi:pimeloyl-ACP methyl ester carboxylesterase